jgi:co-chaperonin GroES (HSP10)
MNSNEQRQALGKPYLQKLKDLGMGLSMDRVLGDRVLIMPITPFTEMDKVEKAGLLFIPDSARDINTPPPTTGEVIMVGPEVGSVITIGEAVMFSRFAGMDIMLDNVAMKLVHINEIACVLKAANPDAIELVEDSHA